MPMVATFNTKSLGDHVSEIERTTLDLGGSASFGLSIDPNFEKIPAFIRDIGTAFLAINIVTTINTTDSPTLDTAQERFDWWIDKMVEIADSLTPFNKNGYNLVLDDGTGSPLTIASTFLQSCTIVRGDHHLKEFAWVFVKPLGT